MSEEYDHTVHGITFPCGSLTSVTCASDGTLYVSGARRVYTLDLSSGIMTKYAGDGTQLLSKGFDSCPRSKVQFNDSVAIGAGENNVLWAVEASAHQVLRITDQATLYAGDEKGYLDGERRKAKFNSPQRVSELNGCIYIADCWNHAIRKIDENGMVTTIGVGGTDYLTGSLKTCGTPYPRGLCVGRGNSLVVTTSGPHKVSYLDLEAETMTEVAGSQKGFRNGGPAEAQFNFPFDAAVDHDNGDIYVADDDNLVIRKVDWETFAVTTFAGQACSESSAASRLTHDGTIGKRSKIAIGPPTSITFTTNGDLVWTSRDPVLRFIPKLASSLTFKLDLLPAFSSYLFDSKYSDRSISLPDGKTLHLHSSLLSLLWGLSTDSLESFISQKCTDIPQHHIVSFLKMLYCDESEVSEMESNALLDFLPYAWYMAQSLFPGNNEHSLTRWCARELKMRITPLTNREMLQLAQKLISSSSLFVLLPEFESLWLSIMSPRVKDPESSSSISLMADSAEVKDLLSKLSNFCAMPSVLLLSPPSSAFATALTSMEALSAKMIEDSSSKSEKGHTSQNSAKFEPEPDFEFALASNTSFKAHEIILYSKWSYFKRMIDSGLTESKEKRAELSSDFSLPAFSVLLQYLYGNQVSDYMKEEMKDDPYIAPFLYENSLLYGITCLDDNGVEVSSPGFSSLLKYLKLAIDARAK